MKTHVETSVDSWMANIDFQGFVNLGKVIKYLNKYVTKPESDMIEVVFYVSKDVLTQTLHRGKPVVNTLKRVIC